MSYVFLAKKGVGEKRLVNDLNPDDFEIFSKTPSMVSNIKPGKIEDNEFDILNKIRADNGKTGEGFVFENIKKFTSENAKEAFHVSKLYPTSPYDIGYMGNGVKKYVEVKATSGSKRVFYMSSGEIAFMEKYKENWTLVLVTKCRKNFKEDKIYKCDDVLILNKFFPKVRFSE